MLIPSYLVMYLWKEACRQEGLDLFFQLLHLLSVTQRQEDCEHDTDRVSIIYDMLQHLIYLSYDIYNL